MLLAGTAAADEPVESALPLRNLNPFLQVFGSPQFTTDRLAEPGRWEFGMSLDIANDADTGELPGERVVIDAEIHVAAFTLRRRVAERFELGLYVPYVSINGGFLDNVITEWHSAFGISNSKRAGESGQVALIYERDGSAGFAMTSSGAGIGDVQLTAAMPLGGFTLRSAVKFPTGDPDSLLGSGGTDVSLGLYASHITTVFERDLQMSGFAGAVALGDGEVLPDLQRSVVPYGGFALRWQATPKLGLMAQWYAQGSYFDSDIDEIGTSTLQLGVGVDYRLSDDGLRLRLGLAEDIVSNATPDVAFQLSIGR